jgi:hypothetical protein
MFSAVLAVLALIMAYSSAKKICSIAFGGSAYAFGLFAFFTAAFSFIFWNQAVEAKGGIYMLNLLFLTLQLCLAVDLICSYDPGRMNMLFFICGLSMANHWPSQIIFIPVLMYPVFINIKKVSIKNMAASVLLAAIGMSAYLYLPLRAMNSPVLNIGNPSSFGSFWWVVSRAGYSAAKIPFMTALKYQAPAMFSLFAGNYSILWVLAPAGIYGLVKKGYGKLAGFLGAVMLVAVFFPVFINTTSREDLWMQDIFLMPALYIMLLFIAAGAAFIYGLLKRSYTKQLFTVILALLIAAMGFNNFKKNDSSRDFNSYDFGNNILSTADYDGVIFAEGDYYIMPVIYMQDVLKRRTDVKLAITNFLQFGWGAGDFGKKYGYIQYKDGDPEYNVNSIIGYYKDKTKIYKTIFTPNMDSLNLPYGSAQYGLLRVISDGKAGASSSAIFKIYAVARGFDKKYLDNSPVNTYLSSIYAACMVTQAQELQKTGSFASSAELMRMALFYPDTVIAKK